ncbi:hypothetical protein B7463_g2036, partial [Scytalidium lignicola]
MLSHGDDENNALESKVSLLLPPQSRPETQKRAERAPRRRHHPGCSSSPPAAHLSFLTDLPLPSRGYSSIISGSPARGTPGKGSMGADQEEEEEGEEAEEGEQEEGK